MTRKSDVALLVVIFSCLSTQAFAYLDPGTGSIVRRQNIWRRWLPDLAECRPLVGDVKRRACGV
ncbi:MAG: hypothetical protein K5821_08560, partial [Nitrobacter sp.]|nr:hypothetical protein [Nitrobacter sp.]